MSSARSGPPFLSIDPRVKLIVALAFVLAAVTGPAASPFVALGLVLAAVVGLPPRELLGRLALVLPLVLLMGLYLPLRDGAAGFEFLLAALAKALASVLWLSCLAWVTPPGELLRGLWSLGSPEGLVTTLFLTLGALERLRHEGQCLSEARGLRLAGARGALRWRGLGYVVGSLFLRALHRARALDDAFELRGGRLPLRPLAAPRARDALFALLALGLLAATLSWSLRLG